jgi:copper chaperone CopZ
VGAESFIDDLGSVYHCCSYMPVQRALFKVVGMYRTTCKLIVEKQLKGEQAIKKIDFDFMTDIVIVGYDSEMLTKEEINEKLKNSGYKFSYRVGAM